jgi:hypothetical protein
LCNAKGSQFPDCSGCLGSANGYFERQELKKKLALEDTSIFKSLLRTLRIRTV